MKLKTLKTIEATQTTSTQIFAVVFAIAFAALLASGCSTQPVSGDSVNTSDTSSAYSNCYRVLTSQGRTTYQCDTVSSTYGSSSYSQYTQTKTALTSKVSPTEMHQAYETYLSSVSPQALADMNAQWNALAAQGN